MPPQATFHSLRQPAGDGNLLALYELYNSFAAANCRQPSSNQTTANPPPVSNQEGTKEVKNMSSSDQHTSNQSAKDQQLNQRTYQPPKDSPHGVQPSGPRGDNPATAGPGPGPTEGQATTPESRVDHINPSAPENINTTPGSTHEN
jgi:hypothetical protein